MDLTKREKVGLAILAAAVIIIISIFYFNNNKKGDIQVINKESSDKTNNQQSDNAIEISVYICGEVQKPGVYTLKEDDRLIRLIGMAGGFTAKADVESINLASKLKDEDFIKIPAIISEAAGMNPQSNGTAESAGTTAVTNKMSTSSNSKININTATVEQLDTLPRIGPAIAQRIIDYRKSNGSFKDISEIKNVAGIGDKTFEDLKDKITIH